MRIIDHLLIACISLAGSIACGAAPAAGIEEGDAVGVTTEALAPNALTHAESSTVLELVDDICGDTWCAGDYDFAFRRVNCEKRAKTCTLLFQIFPREGVASARPSYWRACKTHDFTGFGSLVATAPNGYQSLDPEYYDALTECISRVETKLH